MTKMGLIYLKTDSGVQHRVSSLEQGPVNPPGTEL